MNLRTIISRRRKALKAAEPKSRDRLRYRLRVAVVAEQIRREVRA